MSGIAHETEGREAHRRPAFGGTRGCAAALLLTCAVALAVAGPALADHGRVGEVAPELEAIELDGREPTSIAAQRGTAVLLNKWSTWCRPCVEEMPFLEQLHQRYKGRGFSVVGISIDRPGADGNVRAVADRRGATYPIWLDPEDLFTPSFRSTGVPESVLLDKRGVVVRRWPGALSEGDETIGPAIERAIASEGSYAAIASQEVEDSAVQFGLIGLFAAAFAGLLSFLSPCVLPLVPSYMAFLAGVGAAGGSGGPARRSTTFVHALAFVIGFSIVFVLLGLSATAIGGAFRENSDWPARLGGVLLICFGLVAAGLIPLAILQRDTRLINRAPRLRRLGVFGSGAIGVAFGAGWTPCIGPVLAGVLALAATSGNTLEGAALLTAYSAGLAIPFLLAALAIGRFRARHSQSRWIPWVNRVSGVLLVALGVLLITGGMTTLSEWFARFTPSWLG